MKRKIRKILIAVLACVFAVSAAMLIRELLQYRQGEETYAEAEELAGIPDFSGTPEPQETPDAGASASSAPGAVYVDPYAEELKNMDFSALQAVNGEVMGWILIPNTVISYPLLQTDNNSYYLKHTWKKWTSAVGSIFLEHQNSRDFSDFNTVIYGHNMNNGSMFGSLKKYKSSAYWKSHPAVYLTDDSGSRTYQIFAAYEVSTDGLAYQIGFPSEASRQAFLDDCLSRSVIDTGVVPAVGDQIITLSTCTGHGHATRWVVQAVLKSEAASDDVPSQAAEGADTAPETQPQETPASSNASTAPESENQEPQPAASDPAQRADASTAPAEAAAAGEGTQELPAA